MELLTPDEFFERVGVRVPDSVIRNLEAIEEQGWCPEHDRPCPWGCEMECFLQDAEWREPGIDQLESSYQVDLLRELLDP